MLETLSKEKFFATHEINGWLTSKPEILEQKVLAAQEKVSFFSNISSDADVTWEVTGKTWMQGSTYTSPDGKGLRGDDDHYVYTFAVKIGNKDVGNVFFANNPTKEQVVKSLLKQASDNLYQLSYNKGKVDKWLAQDPEEAYASHVSYIVWQNSLRAEKEAATAAFEDDKAQHLAYIEECAQAFSNLGVSREELLNVAKIAEDISADKEQPYALVVAGLGLAEKFGATIQQVCDAIAHVTDTERNGALFGYQKKGWETEASNDEYLEKIPVTLEDGTQVPRASKWINERPLRAMWYFLYRDGDINQYGDAHEWRINHIEIGKGVVAYDPSLEGWKRFLAITLEDVGAKYGNGRRVNSANSHYSRAFKAHMEKLDAIVRYFARQ